MRDNLCYAPTASPSAAELASLTSLLGIGSLLSAMPARLSGGQAHRVALGRLLLAHCDVLLLDEPYTGLDASLRRTLTDLVSSLVAERSIPAVLVTHELADAQAFADHLAILDRGELLQIGAPDEVVLRPASRRVAELIGYLGFVPNGETVSRRPPRAGDTRCLQRPWPRAGRYGHRQPARQRRLGSRPADRPVGHHLPTARQAPCSRWRTHRHGARPALLRAGRACPPGRSRCGRAASAPLVSLGQIAGRLGDRVKPGFHRPLGW